MSPALGEQSPATAIGTARVDVWFVALDRTARDAGDSSALDGAERRRASRMRVDGVEWAASRVALRRVLADALGVRPADVRLETALHGKPRLAAGAPLDLRFSLSRSGPWALLAVRVGADVGVDIERIRAGVRGDDIARDVLGVPLNGADFFRQWARREALAKAAGHGMIRPAETAEAARFTVRELDGPPGFAAAIASEGDGWCVRLGGES